MSQWDPQKSKTVVTVDACKPSNSGVETIYFLSKSFSGRLLLSGALSSSTDLGATKAHVGSLLRIALMKSWSDEITLHFLSFSSRQKAWQSVRTRWSSFKTSSALPPKVPSSRYQTPNGQAGLEETARNVRAKSKGPSGSPCWTLQAEERRYIYDWKNI